MFESYQFFFFGIRILSKLLFTEIMLMCTIMHTTHLINIPVSSIKTNILVDDDKTKLFS